MGRGLERGEGEWAGEEEKVLSSLFSISLIFIALTEKRCGIYL